MSVQRVLKLVIDRVLALSLLVILAPVLLVIAAAVAVDDGRPVLFFQPRVGLKGRPFRMLKFRTMVRGAIEIGRAQRLSQDPFGLLPNDPRITRSGRFLRRTGLDELPQLLNILRGEMSLVGPRPDLVEQAANYTERDRGRLAVLPGITGWSQVNGRDEIGWPERIEQDLWYIAHWSLWLDVRIVLLTIRQIFREEPVPVEDTMNITRAREAAERERRATEAE